MNTMQAHNQPVLLTDAKQLSFLSVVHQVYFMLLRQRSRKALAALDSRQLADIGLSKEQALGESAKLFWTN